MFTVVIVLINGHLAPSQKYVHVNKNIEIVNKHIFQITINIVSSNDNFHFILQCIKITMY